MRCLTEGGLYLRSATRLATAVGAAVALSAACGGSLAIEAQDASLPADAAADAFDAGAADAGTDGTTSTDGSVGHDAAMDGSRDAGIEAGHDAGDAGADAFSCSQIPTDCGLGGMCKDCTVSAAGHACLSGQCGCAAASDCPAGTACDPGTHTCSPSCAGGLACNGGCCDGSSCVAGDTALACGSSGAACVTCSGATPTCAAGACTSHCDVDAGTCGAGYCCAAGACVAVSDKTCAPPGGDCVDCTADLATSRCLPNGTCGCITEADCALFSACGQGVCTSTCSNTSPCNGGCCAGVCEPGDTSDSCATGQTTCTGCLQASDAPACTYENGTRSCGCLTAYDCLDWGACDLGTHQCTTACDAQTPCYGGCCSAPQNGTCVFQGSNSMCNTWGLCIDCSNASTGHVCLNVRQECGCYSNADCGGGAQCLNNKCVTACDAQHPCVGGCCSAAVNGTCVSGADNWACATTGAVCQDCTQNNPGARQCVTLVGSYECGCWRSHDCPAGQACDGSTFTCTTACGPNQPCNGGCCSNGTCVPGSADAACGGLSGDTCVDCSTQVTGKVCISHGQWANACGCVTDLDCWAPYHCNGGACTM